MVQLYGFTGSNKSLVIKFHNALYSFKLSPRQWYKKLHQTLFQFGFVSSKCDHSLFFYSRQGIVLYALNYMDDILFIYASLTFIQDLITKLCLKFSLKKLGRHWYFLGIEVTHHDQGSIMLSQLKYIKDLLIHTHVSNSNGALTPMLSNLKISKFGLDVFSDTYYYRSLFGDL